LDMLLLFNYLIVYGNVYGTSSRLKQRDAVITTQVMATVAIVLNTTYKLANSQYAVALRVTHERKPKYYSISSLVANQNYHFHCTIDHWKPAELEDNGLGRFRKSFIYYKECNEILKTKLSEANKILQRYDQNNQPFTFEAFESDLKHKEPVVPIVPAIVQVVVQPMTTLQTYYSQQILLLEEQGRVGQAGLNKEAQSILLKFMKNPRESEPPIRSN